MRDVYKIILICTGNANIDNIYLDTYFMISNREALYHITEHIIHHTPEIESTNFPNFQIFNLEIVFKTSYQFRNFNSFC